MGNWCWKKNRWNYAGIFEPKSPWLFYILGEIGLWIEKTTQVNDCDCTPVLVKGPPVCWHLFMNHTHVLRTSIHIIKHTQHSLFYSILILFCVFKRDLHWSPSPTAWPILGNQKFNHVIKNIVQILSYTSRLWASTTSLGCLFQGFKRNKTSKKEWGNAKINTF